jgi:hypothetical protein
MEWLYLVCCEFVCFFFWFKTCNKWMFSVDFEPFSCRTRKKHREQGPTSEMFERVLIDLIFGEYQRAYNFGSDK